MIVRARPSLPDPLTPVGQARDGDHLQIQHRGELSDVQQPPLLVTTHPSGPCAL